MSVAATPHPLPARPSCYTQPACVVHKAVAGDKDAGRQREPEPLGAEPLGAGRGYAAVVLDVVVNGSLNYCRLVPSQVP